MSRARVVGVALAVGTLGLLPGCAWISQADVSLTGGSPNQLSDHHWISPNGRHVFFDSPATDLVPETAAGDPGNPAIYRRDNKTGVTTRLRGDASLSKDAGISQDLQRILLSGSSTGGYVVWDRGGGNDLPVAVDSAERPLAGGTAAATLSGDGRFVAFRQERETDVATLVRDLDSGTTREVASTSKTADNTWLGYFLGFPPLSISHDGSVVVQSTCVRSEFISRLPSCLAWHLELVDVIGRAVATPRPDQPGEFQARISGDGRFVAFTDGEGVRAYNRLNGTVQLISADRDGQAASGSEPSISANGRYIAFSSSARNLIEGFDVFQIHVYIRDRVRGTTTLASTDLDGDQLPGFSAWPVTSARGRYVVFRNFSTATGTWGLFTKSVRIPRIEQVTPPTGARGTTVRLDVSGSAFLPGAEISVSQNLTYLRTSFPTVSEQSAQFDVTIPDDAPTGAYDVTIYVPGAFSRESGAGTRCSGCFTVS
jgi:Tol biopolymer transport system component